MYSLTMRKEVRHAAMFINYFSILIIAVACSRYKQT